ncbi:cbb3-type cytochrome c oxidase N-terminal domain-containing protein [Echinicola vietnamensis]|uniref:Cytochrome c, mono-and diheme variants family n=1 Tax=Echinicola vietnamensis (strain DSM 17526 / LMG 23754 / KMM 6221) TaxID=926556 RepID=L0G2C2_ECHVK|nr:cbb3-type cytochrome c oxidase N-terminal domain-containing protein [Echinicola vietnamensis]AGA79126.1 cytochrome c, mono- and diheme variants family [Echinicola vietnamensis DSM 17526]
MKKNKAVLLTTFMGLASSTAFAQNVEEPSFWSALGTMNSSELMLLLMIIVMLGVLVLLLLLMIYLMSFMVTLLKRENPALANQPSWWEQFNERFVSGKLKPVEEEGEIMLSHNYDGIRELDNFMPPWLTYLFYGSTIFAIFYLINYSAIGWGKTPEEEYQAQLKAEEIAAEKRKELALASIDESNVEFDQSEFVLTAGGTIYQNNCVACHAADGGGGVGPNFTDQYWLHGGSIQDVFKTVKYGVPDKGMIPWQDQLSPEEIMQVSNYILSLQGKTPANPKEPQGELYVPDNEEGETDAADSTGVQPDSVKVDV